jgi:hypothetical protein
MLNLPVYGSCDSVADSSGFQFRGPQALPSDFVPKFSFKESETYAVNLHKAKRATLRGPNPDIPSWIKHPPSQVFLACKPEE